MTHEEELNKAAEEYSDKNEYMEVGFCLMPIYIGDKMEEAFIAGAKWGYQQAEKDLEWEINHREEAYMNGVKDGLKERLTIEDLELLHTFLYAVKNNKSGCFTFTRLSDEQYQEVLRRFNQKK